MTVPRRSIRCLMFRTELEARLRRAAPPAEPIGVYLQSRAEQQYNAMFYRGTTLNDQLEGLRLLYRGL